MQRRLIIQAIASLAGASVTASSLMAQTKPRVEAWKAPGCGCCEDWARHLEANGFQVTMHESGSAAARTRLHVPEKLGSCHTAQVGGYALEGHVPAREIRRLLKERPTAVGLAVPGMIIGSPGMDGPAYGGRKDPYDVLLISADGSTRVYQSYNRT
ncbi:MAG TPA: DUF411 domain-containing protein [Polaromonas sp.]|nr:DUF411 domain-containing protein [Polaromonas sp.]